MSGFAAGLSFWVRGWGLLLTQRRLLMLAIVPFLIAVTIAGVFTWILFGHLASWVEMLVTFILGTTSGFWSQLLYYPLVVGGGLLLLVSCVFVSYFAHSILAIPFYSLLAERALILNGLKVDRSFMLGVWLRTSLRMLRVSVIKSILFLSLGVLLFILSFIPVVNIIAIFLTLMILAFDLLDYSFEGMEYGLRERLGLIWRNRSTWAGMALALGLTLFIPGFTLVIAPGAVVGGTLVLQEILGKK